MERTKTFFVSILSFAIVLFLASTARAQIDVGNFTISGGAEVGGLFGNRSGSDSKFEEYRDLTHNIPIVPELQFMLGGKKEDFYLNFDASKLGYDDQNYRLRVGRYGLLDIEFEWDQLPHLFSEDTAQTPYNRPGGGGTFTLPSRPIPTGPLSGGLPTFLGSDTKSWLARTEQNVDLKTINGFSRFKVRYTPTPGWTFTANYSAQDTSGKRALGALFGTPGSYSITEQTEPISYLTHNIEIGGEYAGKGWSVGLRYNGSIFHNSIGSLTWDNPFHTVNVAGQCIDNTGSFNPATGVGPCRGRIDLYPDNQAHTATLYGAAALPLKTRFMGTVSYGVRLQDDPFGPLTVNSAILAATPVTISRNDLGGDVRPFMVNATLVNNLIDRLNLKAYYRYYDLSNHNKTVTEPQGIIVNDQGAPTIENEPGRFAYSRGNLGAEGGYNVTRWLSAKLGWDWERMHRQDLDVRNTDEYTLGPAFDITPLSWVSFRASYKHSWRNSPNYQSIDEGDIANIARTTFEAARSRNKASLYAQVRPWSLVSFHAGFELIGDRYPDTQLGVTRNTEYSPSIGVTYTPIDWATLFANYNWDRSDWKMHAQDRANTAQNPQTNPASVWNSIQRDDTHTISVGSDMNIIKDILGFRLQYSVSMGRTVIHASGDSASTGLSNGASNFPPFESVWHELLARFEWRLTKTLGLRFGYYFNHFNEQDGGVDVMQPFMGDLLDPTSSTPVNANLLRSVFLGDKIKAPFTAHMGFMTLVFKF